MKKKRGNEKVVPFAQLESNERVFRHEHAVSEEVQKVMINEVTNKFRNYAFAHFFDMYVPVLEEFIDEHNPKLEKRKSLLHNLFWCRLLFESSLRDPISIVDSFIEENDSLMKKKPILMPWLREWEKTVPKFYFVGAIFHNSYFLVIDILTSEIKEVMMLDPEAVPPKEGEIVFGTLIPLGNGDYFPIVDFYHFDYGAREAMASCMSHHFRKYLKNETIHEAFIHVLSIMLQIERHFLFENALK
ncbi:hypothetical protein [Evansella tamaricis]|uniref:Uncharacterized protein n=1 Tax=Evansella tamaricis TaxID=2069301 RepID=A0ABS6JGM9_9BACI|nr:hypothetical protein [Evansella tamaricis]MBU9711473.1 hypothetical protein [Evansella tamaricis]